MSDALICPKCGTPYRRNQLSCMKCNSLLFDPKASTVHIRVDPNLLRLRRARATQEQGQTNANEHMLHLLIRGLIEKLAFEEETEIVLGRIDLGHPDPSRFDLTPYGGHERGVSRTHALLRYTDNHFTITDLNSANGTTVNLRKLLPDEPLVIHDGDQLMLGSLSIGIRFEMTPVLRKTGPLPDPSTVTLEAPPKPDLPVPLPVVPPAVITQTPPIPASPVSTPETTLDSSTKPAERIPTMPESLPEEKNGTSILPKKSS